MPDFIDSILLGRIAKAFGLRGGVFVRLCNDDSRSLEVGKKLTLRHDSHERVLTISAILDGSRVFFEEITDRTLAEKLCGAELWMDRAILPTLQEDEFYLFDMLHANVIDTKAHALGTIVGFSTNNAQVLFDVKTMLGHIAHVPSVKPIVQKIDCENKIVIIDPPAGLLDPMD